MYDYIIVGAGSAGCVIANRLTEDPMTPVLLLEAGGPDDKPEIHIPGATFSLQKTDIDWAYHTEPQPHLNERTIFWPRGKVLGGSSSINAMIYIRGHRQCYDDWQASGNEGWGYADVLPYFRKSEHQERGASVFHATGGPLNVADQRDANPLSCILVDAARELGIKHNDDFNGEEMSGFGIYQVTQKDGQRWSTASAYLKSAMKRSNLNAITNAHVTRLLFKDQRVVGVAYVKGGETRQAEARRGVILCGGAINSPQLLLLSGIGPAKKLQTLGIPVIRDLPGVGQNLQDHLDIAVRYQCTEPISNSVVYAVAEVKYRYFRKGPWSSNLVEAGGFLRTKSDLPIPDLQLHFGPQLSANFEQKRPEDHGFCFFPALLLPKSRGYVALHSADPLEPPIIQPNYLANEADLAVLVEGIKLARKLAQTRAFAPFVGEAVQPGPEVQSDADIGEYIRNQADTIYHPVGTCKMGVDAMAVVNPRLQVHGVQGLWVADASIMPTIVNGNTNAPTIMIGEKAVDMIKATSAV